MKLHLAGGQSLVGFPRAHCQSQPCSTLLSVIWMLEGSASSAGSLLILNWKVVLTVWSDERPCREIWICWSLGQSPMACNSTRVSAGICSWDGVVPDTGTDREASSSRASLQKGIWCWSQQAQREPAVCPGSQESKLHFGMHYTQHNQNEVKRGDSPAIFSIGAASPAILCTVLGSTI